MQEQTTDFRGGPGSSVMLAERTIKVRDAVIAQYADKPLEEVNEFIKQMLEKEEDEQKRLGLLAARVYILRMRIMTLFGTAEAPAAAPANTDTQPAEAASGTADKAEDQPEGEQPAGEAADWKRLRILETSEVNGVKFLAGMILDVNRADAEKLIENGKAELRDSKTDLVDTEAAEAGQAEAVSEAAQDTAEETADEAVEETPEETPEELSLAEQALAEEAETVKTAEAAKTGNNSGQESTAEQAPDKETEPASVEGTEETKE